VWRSGGKAVLSCAEEETFYSLLQSLLLYDVSFSHKTQQTVRKLTSISNTIPAPKADLCSKLQISNTHADHGYSNGIFYLHHTSYTVQSAITAAAGILILLLFVTQRLTVRVSVGIKKDMFS